MSDLFKQHEPCPACGSRDNLARYMSGSAYCFGCGYSEGSKRSPYLYEETVKDKVVQLPNDCSTEFTPDMIAWCAKYRVDVPMLLRNDVVCSKWNNQLIFPFYNSDSKCLLWQGRNFTAGRKKYYTEGTPEEVLPIYHSTNKERKVVIVEDCISAIRLSKFFDAMPALGSEISKNKMCRLKNFYDSIVFWMDGNMFNKSVKMASYCRSIGMDANVVYTELDPKEYSNEEINAALDTAVGCV